MSRENVEIVRQVLDAFNRRDDETVRALWTADGEWWPAFLGGGLLEGAVYRGHEGVAEFIEVQAETWETIVAEPVDMRDLGNRVLVTVHLKAVGRTSGVAVDRTTWNVFELRDDKVSAGRVYATKEEALEAVGLSE
jgi:ketosteroid isomerase-like protein